MAGKNEETTGHQHDVFISYADADRAWVDGFLIDGLGRAGVRCHREAAFALGAPRLAEFETAVRSCARILLVLSPAYFASETASFVDLLAQTFGMETSTWPVIPLRLEPVALPTRLSMLTSLDATDPDERELVLRKLCDLFQRPIPAAAERPACPYPGMRAFTLDDRLAFFGRERETEELLQHLRQSRFLTVIGCSGSGKSSLVFAGLVPALRKTALFGPGTWRILSMRPGERPLDELARVFGADPADPAAAVVHAMEADPEAKHLLLIVDQFEEVFSSEQGRAAPFFQAIQRLLECETVYLVLTVRADFYAELMGTSLWKRIQANRLDVGPLDEAGLREAIYRPADSVGVYVESDLVERLTADAVEANSLGILPLVQEALVLLWEKLERRVLPLHAYESLVLPRRAYDRTLGGQQFTGLEVAIARHADGVLKRLEAEEPARVEIARRVFLRMVQFGEGRPDTRRQQAVAQLRAGTDPAAFEATLGTLAKNRLITLTGDVETGRRRADIAHEALIRGWPTLQGWIAESRKAEELRRKLERKAQEWVDAGAGAEGLLGTAGLAEAEVFVAAPEGRELAEDDPIRRLIRDSRDAIQQSELQREAARRRELEHAQQRVKILLRSAVALGALMVGLVGVALYALHERGKAQTFAAESMMHMAVAAESEKKAKQSAAEARRSEAGAKQMTVDVLVDSGAADMDKGLYSEALKHFAQALSLQGGSPRDQAFNRQRIGFLERQIPRLGAILGHDGPVNSAVFSPEGACILTAGDDHVARLWEAGSGKLVAELKGHSNWVYRAAFSPDGTRIVTASYDGTARVWDWGSGKTLVELSGHAGIVYDASFSPDGRRVLTASEDKTARIWDAGSGKTVHVLEGHTSAVTSAVFSPDGTRILTASTDHTARVWDAGSGERVAVFKGHSAPVSCAGFSPDSKRVVTGAENSEARVWDAGSAQSIVELKGHSASILSAAFSPDGERILTSSLDSTARVWDARTGKNLKALEGHSGYLFSAAYSPDGTRVATASADLTARVWDPDTASVLAIASGHRSIVLSARFSPDGKRLVTACADGEARVWSSSSFDSVARLTEHVAGVRSARFSPDGTRFVTASADKTARIWDARAYRSVPILIGHAGTLNTAEFSPDGARIATASDDRTARLWDTRSAVSIAVLEGHAGPVRSAAFSPDGTHIVTASDDRTARIWIAGSGKGLAVLAGHENPVTSAAYSPDGSRILTASGDGTARIWDAVAHTEIARLGETRVPINTAVFSRDGIRIVTAGYSGTARVWDSSTRNVITQIRGHKGVVFSAVFDLAGERVVTASFDGTARVWDAARGQVIAVLKGHTGPVWSAAFSPDGNRILTASDDGSVRVWQLDPIAGEAETIPLWAEVLTGTLLEGESEGGLTAKEWKDCRRRLKALGDKAPPTPWLSDAEP
jgi:WD40 repeat protein